MTAQHWELTLTVNGKRAMTISHTREPGSNINQYIDEWLKTIRHTLTFVGAIGVELPSERR